MSDVIELMKLLAAGVQKLRAASQEDRAEVARDFLNLSKTFNAFPAAQKAGDFSEMMRLAAKTHGLLDSLRETKVFRKVLGKEADHFFETIENVSNAKDLMTQNTGAEKLKDIITAAGYFEGFAETLSARHVTRDET